ncbi:MAG: hypothetical protein LBB39_01080, partial [Mycoplasmataceae bacterium]|nr:hypothetical protein [Mycoplasmataceae bacterium]
SSDKINIKLVNKLLDEYYEWFNNVRIQKNKHENQYFIPNKKLQDCIKIYSEYNKNTESVQK